MLNNTRKEWGMTWKEFKKAPCYSCSGFMTRHTATCWEFSPYPLEPEDNPFLMDGEDLVGARG